GRRRTGAAALPYYDQAIPALLQAPRWMLHYAACLLEAGEAPAPLRLLARLPESDADSRFEAGLLLGQAGLHADAANMFASARPRYKDAYTVAYNETLMRVEARDYDGAIR